MKKKEKETIIDASELKLRDNDQIASYYLCQPVDGDEVTLITFYGCQPATKEPGTTEVGTEIWIDRDDKDVLIKKLEKEIERLKKKLEKLSKKRKGGKR